MWEACVNKLNSRALSVGVYLLSLSLGFGGQVLVGFGEGEKRVKVETKKGKSITP